jgi:hypothetical protein
MTNVTNVLRVTLRRSETLGCLDVRKLHFVDFFHTRELPPAPAETLLGIEVKNRITQYAR